MLNTILKDIILKLDQCVLGTRLPNPLYMKPRIQVGHQPLVGYLYFGPEKSSKKYTVYYGDRLYNPILHNGSVYMDSFDGHDSIIQFFKYRNEEFNVTETIIDSVLRINSEIIPSDPERSVSRVIQFLIPNQT
jgi:hypothetical protein